MFTRAPQSLSAQTSKRNHAMAAPRPEDKNAEQERAHQSAQQRAEMANRVGKTAADVSERAARVGLEVVQRNNQAAQHLWEASTQMITQLAKESSDQFAPSFGISGETAQKSLRTSSANVEALLDSANVLTSASEELSRQWIGMLQEVIESGVSRTEAFTRCRTPHDVVSVQLEAAREGLTAVLRGIRAMSDISGRAAQQARTKISDRVQQVA
jgi:hypothetical protein